MLIQNETGKTQMPRYETFADTLNQLLPEDPYHLAALVELDVVASGSCAHIDLLAPTLKQAAGHCTEHIAAGIEVSRAWVTLCKIRLLLGTDETDAVEALCLATRTAETHHPLVDLHDDLDVLKDAIGADRPGIERLRRMVALLVEVKKHGSPWETDAENSKQGTSSPLCGSTRVLILAGSTDADSDTRLAAFEEPLVETLTGFEGVLLTGGTAVGVCALALRCAARANAAGAHVKTVGYLPTQVKAATGFDRIVRTDGETHSILEALNMWHDLRTAGIPPTTVDLFALGGGKITAQELALAWTLGAQAVAIDCGTQASTRFAAVLDHAPDPQRGFVLPNDPLTAFDAPKTKADKQDCRARKPA